MLDEDLQANFSGLDGELEILFTKRKKNYCVVKNSINFPRHLL